MNSFLPYGVFKTVMGRPGKDKVGPPKLLDEAKSLELGCVNDADQQRVHLHMPMYGIIEHLKVETGRE